MKNASNHEQQLTEENTLTTNNKNRSKNAFTGNITYSTIAIFEAIFCSYIFFMFTERTIKKASNKKTTNFNIMKTVFNALSMCLHAFQK